MDNAVNVKIDKYILGWMVLVHVLSIGAFFYVSWSAVAVFAITYFLTVCVGVTLGLHRLLSHRTFKAPRWVERAVGLCGLLSGQGPVAEWVAHHRMHHSFTETPGDPHNANRGFWYSHMFWLFYVVPQVDDPTRISRMSRDIQADPVLRLFSHPLAMVYAQAILGIILLLCGGLPWLFWGVFLRLVVSYHATWFVNSVCHKWGYINFKTDDLTRNSWWVAILTFGEGWHNNHHKYPDSAMSGLRFWEIDVTFQIIRLLGFLGLAWDIRLPAEEAAFAGRSRLRDVSP